MDNLKILVVGNNPIHLMYMMPVVESLVTSKHGQSLYFCTTSIIGTEYKKMVSDFTIREFIKNDIIITGKRYRIGTEIFKVINRFDPDLVFWWNGLGVGTDVVDEVKTHRRVIFCEVGFFPQREHCYLDVDGINYLSSMRNRKSQDINEEQRKKLMQTIRNYEEMALIVDDNLIMEDYIFVPLQLEQDTQITKFSGKFKKMHDLIDFLSKEFPDEKIVVKPHPLDQRSYASRWKNIEIIKDVNTHLLIKNSKFVIGINSTVLSESLLYDKVVCAFGRGIFSGKKVLLEIHNDLHDIKDIYTYIIDKKARENFLYDLVFNCQIKIGDIDSNNIVQKPTVNPDIVLSWFEKNVFSKDWKVKKKFPRFKLLFARLRDAY